MHMMKVRQSLQWEDVKPCLTLIATALSSVPVLPIFYFGICALLSSERLQAAIDKGPSLVRGRRVFGPPLLACGQCRSPLHAS